MECPGVGVGRLEMYAVPWRGGARDVCSAVGRALVYHEQGPAMNPITW